MNPISFTTTESGPTRHNFIRQPGLVSFSSLLESARPVGPRFEPRERESGVSAVPSSRLVSPARLSGSVPAHLPDRAAEWLPAIEQAAIDQGVDPQLLTALVWTESAFRVDAVSPAGAIGLGQLMPGTAAGMGVDPLDPRDNLRGAATYLAQQLSAFGSVDLALAAYNAGPGRVVKSGGIPNIAETQAYVRIVTDRYDMLKSSAAADRHAAIQEPTPVPGNSLERE